MDIKPVAWYDGQHKDFSHVERIGWAPLCPESALTQAREEGRREGMREAAEKYKSLVEAAENMRDCSATLTPQNERLTAALEALNKE